MTTPETGDVIIYPYLWRREAEAGETEGRKSRPTCVAISREIDGSQFLFLLPITTKLPTAGTKAIEIPQLEKQRIGLDIGTRSWIVVDEHNIDNASRSFYYEPQKPVGKLSRQFLINIARQFYVELKNGNRSVDRTSED